MNLFNSTSICSCTSACWRFRQWDDAGYLRRFGVAAGLLKQILKARRRRRAHRSAAQIAYFKLLERHRRAEQISLAGSAAVHGQKIALRRRFHALANHRQAQAMRQRHDGAHEDGVARVDQYVTHEKRGDLELLQQQPFQVKQGRAAGTKIVE